jgi:DNA-binding SARP family transcriptional activator
LEVLDTHGQRLVLGGPKQRALLAVLLLYAGEVVPVEHLIDELWGEEPPDTAAHILQVYVANLRKVLEPGRARGAAGETVRTRPPGYLIEISPDNFDLARFERLVAAGQAALASADPAQAARVFRQALNMWRGRALADIVLAASGQGEVVRLEERRLGAVEDRIEAELACGRHRELTGELEALIAAHPLRERLHGQFMLALYRSGRQAEALEAYRRTRETLAEELGIDPSRPLQELERAVLAQDPTLDLAPTTEPTQAPTTAAASAIPPTHRSQEPTTVAQPAATEREPTEERKVVTVLCCDVAGHSVSSGPADPEDIRARLRLLDDRLQTEVERFGGAVEGSVGDAALAVFGAPVVHEDDPERAVRAGLQVLEAIEDLNRAEPSLDLPVRIGISTGEAVVILHARPDRNERIITGGVVNTAVRLCRLAPIGGVIVDEATWRTTRHPITYEAVKPPQLQGEANSSPIWRATSARSRHGPELERPVTTPFVGRDEELSLLQGVYRRAAREGSVQLVTVTGEPGVGKSRLVRELFTFVDSQPELVTWRQGRCLPYGEGIAFWALGEVLKNHAGVLESDDLAQAAAKLANMVDAVVEDAAEREWLKQRLAPLVGLISTDGAGMAQREEAFAAWRRFLVAVAEKRPLVLVLEDLHWADPALLAFIRHLVEWASHVPLVVVATARPELYDRAPDWAGGLRNATTISLAPLSDAECACLVAALTDQAVLPAEDQAALLERAGGNPLYAEEICRMLADQGALKRDGRMVQLSPSAEIAFPDSIQALIAARLDTLAPDRKALLQDAAVIGKVFWAGALCAMGNLDEANVRTGLQELARREFIRPARSSSVRGEAEYAFWHVLTRDVAYGQIPRVERVRRHQGAAQWIEGLAGQRVLDHAELLAHHYTKALELVRLVHAHTQVDAIEDRARRFLILAGDRALPLDVAKAVSYYEQALALHREEHPDRAAVLTKTAEAARRAGELVRAEHAYEEAVARSRAQHDLLGVGGALLGLAHVLRNRGETARAQAALTEVMHLLRDQPPSVELAEAYIKMALYEVAAGRPEQVVALTDKALAIAARTDIGAQKLRALEHRGLARVQLGDVAGLDDARAALRTALDLGFTNHAVSIANNLGEDQWPVQGPAAALETLEWGFELASQRGLVEAAMYLRISALGPQFDLGDWERLLQTAEEVRTWSETHGEEYLRLWAEFRQAEVLVHRGKRARAKALAARFLPGVRAIGELEILAPALTAAALIEHAQGRPVAAGRLVDELSAATNGRSAWQWAKQLPDLVRLCVATGRSELAGDLVGRAQEPAARHRHGRLTAQAIMAEASGDLDGAARAYGQAAAQWADYGHLLERGRALLGLGRCLVQLGRPEGRNRLVEARAVFAHLGARPLLAETDGWLQRAIAHG